MSTNKKIGAIARYVMSPQNYFKPNLKGFLPKEKTIQVCFEEDFYNEHVNEDELVEMAKAATPAEYVFSQLDIIKQDKTIIYK